MSTATNLANRFPVYLVDFFTNFLPLKDLQNGDLSQRLRCISLMTH